MLQETALIERYKAARANLWQPKPEPKPIPITQSELVMQSVPVSNVIALEAIHVRPQLIHDKFPTLRLIGDEITHFYELTRAQFVAKRKEARIVRARQIGMYLARQMTPKSFPQIGKWLGGMDHTTILHGSRKIERLLLTDDRLHDEVDILRLRIAARIGGDDVDA